MAKIHITNLHLRTIIGVFDWERKHKQAILVNIIMEYDAIQAAQSDNIEDTVDYNEVANRIIKQVESHDYHLLEKLCEEILHITLENPLVKCSIVRVDKPRALPFADSVSVEMTREQ